MQFENVGLTVTGLGILHHVMIGRNQNQTQAALTQAALTRAALIRAALTRAQIQVKLYK